MGFGRALAVVLVVHSNKRLKFMLSQSVKQIKTNKHSSSELSDDAPKVTQAMLDGARFRVGLQDVQEATIRRVVREELSHSH
jgi:hypothetical protein